MCSNIGAMTVLLINDSNNAVVSEYFINLLLLAALQLYVSFGLFNYPFPFISILCEFLPVLDLHHF
jgi:hypothetical protein